MISTRHTFFSAIFVLSLVLLPACNIKEKDPLRVAFVGGLTGRTASLGISGRNGAMLAVEEVNDSGGIDGHMVELTVVDDQQNPEQARNVIRSLVSADYPVVIGPMTSSMAVVMAPEVNNTQTLLISPTVSTMLLGQQDDNFLRIYPQCMDISRTMAEHVYGEKGLHRFAIIYDLGNKAFTESWKKCFTNQFSKLGGEVVDSVSFTSAGHHSFNAIVNSVLAREPDGILLLANSLDAAMLAQQVLKSGVKVPLFTSEWSMTRDLLQSGGSSVEGVTLFHTFNEDSRLQRYLDFKQRYRKHFNEEAAFPAIHAYDAIRIVLSALRKGARTGPELKKVILAEKNYESLQGSLSFNAYGDVNRDLFLTVIKNREFHVVREVKMSGN